MSSYKLLLEHLNKSAGVFIPNPHKGMRDVFNIHQGEYTLIGSNTGTGKALPNSEIVLTPNGWIANGSLEKGDYAIGSNGNKTKVLGVYPQGKRDIYEVKFSDGSSVKCDIEHLWSVKRPGKSQQFKTVSTRELLTRKLTSDRLDTRYNTIQTRLNYQIPLGSPIVFENSKDLPLDAYTLGVLLGDGGLTRGTLHVSLNNKFDLTTLKFPKGITMNVTEDKPNHKTYSLVYDKASRAIPNVLTSIIKDLGLHGHKSTHKFIPTIYLKSSIEDRISLLKGLLVTDGYQMKNSGIEYSTSSSQLMLNVRSLLGSLGIFHRVVSRIPHYRDKEGNKIICSVNYRIYINKSKSFKSIKSITKLNYTEESTCIRVAAFDSLYVTNGYTLTHNTSMVDDTFVLRPYEWLKNNPQPNVHYEGVYFSMERKKLIKIAKWTSWLLYERGIAKIPYKVILKRDALRKLSFKEERILDVFQSEMDPILDMFDIQDGIKTVRQIERQIEYKARKLGSYFYTDDVKLWLWGKEITTFSAKGRLRDTNRGKVPYVKFSYKGKSYVLDQNSRLYIPNVENTFFFILIDHIGKISELGYGNKKKAIDALDSILSDARDKYGFSPIVISQFNRGIGDIHRIRESKGNLEPLIEDFKDSGNPQESADLILSMFDPYRYGSYDTQGFYKGYDITKGTLSPNGAQRFRSFHVLKNSYGIGQVAYGMKFLGEYMRFDQLPLPNDIKLANIYADIASGH